MKEIIARSSESLCPWDSELKVPGGPFEGAQETGPKEQRRASYRGDDDSRRADLASSRRCFGGLTVSQLRLLLPGYSMGFQDLAREQTGALGSFFQKLNFHVDASSGSSPNDKSAHFSWPGCLSRPGGSYECPPTPVG